MNENSFIKVTTEVFDKLAKQFDLVECIKYQKVVYASTTYKLSIYFDNFFEINIWFDFLVKNLNISLSLDDLVKYLEFDEQTIECVQHNQITDENYYKSYIKEISKVCRQIILTTQLDENVVFNCFYWKEQKKRLINEDYNVVYVENALNELWNEKKYKNYLDYYLKNLNIINNSKRNILLEKRASYAERKTGDRTQGDGSSVLD